MASRSHSGRPFRWPLPRALLVSVCVLGVPWWAHRRRRAKVRVERLLAVGTEAANIRLTEIGSELEEAARENVLAPLVAAENAAGVWESLDLSRKRAIVDVVPGV